LSQKPTRPRQVVGVVEDKGVRERWRVIHGRRERLEYTAERLALEIEQKVSSLDALTLGETTSDEFESVVVGVINGNSRQIQWFSIKLISRCIYSVCLLHS
jgi:hypothetical protein